MKKYLFSLLLILMVTVLVHSQDMDKMSMDSKHEFVYNNLLNALTSGNLEMLDKYVAPDFIEHDPGPMMTKKTGIERIKEDFASYHKIFPDMKSKVHNIAVTGDMLFAYITFTGTSAESFMGMPANHKMTMNMVDLVRFKGDKIAEHWGFTSNEDMMKMMPQDKMSQNKMMDKEMK
jgi:predicted ester cyclase